MSYDAEVSAYANFVAVLEVIEDQGDNANETIILDAIDDILSAHFSDGQTLGMIKAIMRSWREGEIDDDAQKEYDKTRAYLHDHKGE